MSEPLIYGLLAGALIVPVLGALLLRLLTNRVPESVINGGAVVLFIIAIASVLVLVRSNITSLNMGNLTLLLPLTQPAAQPPADVLPTPFTNTRPITAEADTRRTTTRPLPTTPTLTTTTVLTATAPTTPTTTVTNTATITTTATVTNTVIVTTTATITTTAPTEPDEPPEPDEPETYTLQPGDTLFDLAIQFDVTIEELLEANNLTEEEAGTLQPGDELRIP